ncbi:hypothetical protein RUM43_012120 [Polyplax serrata]|uniref:ZP domain-containing protein n=1 Tax=Polyplax serrata TaxID=468196 RepID=A0AAN8P734_POLSC
MPAAGKAGETFEKGDKECHPQIEGNKAIFQLSMNDIHRCGVTRISDKLRNKTMYYHRIIVEYNGNGHPEKESFLVKCVTASKSNHGINKRNVLPAGFQEPEDLEITTSLTEKAPEPMLSAVVRQGKERVTGEVNVIPGTPLTMEIYLDKSSAPVYGILVSFMQVTDTKQQEETIIFNGCSVDPYLFENFNTVDGDFLSAKFRAFKFPDSTYVQFKGTVNVCLDKCQGVQCSNGQIGYGRRRRSVDAMPPDPNKLYEVSLTTFIKINFVENVTQELKSEEVTSETKNSTDGSFNMREYKRLESGLIAIKKDKSRPVTDNVEKRKTLESLNEEFKYSVIEEAKNLAPTRIFSIISLLPLAAVVLNNFLLK